MSNVRKQYGCGKIRDILTKNSLELQNDMENYAQNDDLNKVKELYLLGVPLPKNLSGVGPECKKFILKTLKSFEELKNSIMSSNNFS